MKAKMYSAESNTTLHKTIDDFYATHAGIKNLKAIGVLKDDPECLALVEKNIEWFMLKIREFRIAEKMLCIFFTCLFGYFQIFGGDLEMRRGRRVRTRRKGETECPS